MELSTLMVQSANILKDVYIFVHIYAIDPKVPTEI